MRKYKTELRVILGQVFVAVSEKVAFIFNESCIYAQTLQTTLIYGSFKKIFSNVVVTSNSSCVFLYLFSSVNISPVRFVLHLQD